MRAHGHTWDSGVIIDRSAGGLTWLQQVRQRWLTYRAERRQALLLSLGTTWNARRERFRTIPVASALECAADQGGPAMALTLYSAHTDMACTG
jgi:hypothetical protein